MLDTCCPVKMEYSSLGQPGAVYVLQRHVNDTVKSGCLLDGCFYKVSLIEAD